MTDAQRSRQTAEVLRLLDESFRAHRRGDKPTADLKAEEACRPAWADYVQAAQDRAREDEEAQR